MLLDAAAAATDAYALALASVFFAAASATSARAESAALSRRIL